MSFVNKVVLVVGASSGIGAATAISFTKEGADVAIIGRNEEKLKETSEKCKEHGKTPLIIKADISQDEDTKAAVKMVIEKYGNLDILINNAGILKAGSLLSGTLMDTYDEVMNTNLRGLVHITSLLTPLLVKSKGNIVNITSVSASMAASSVVTPYALSKAALSNFTRLAAHELASVGVRVNAICPGPVYTEIFRSTEVDRATLAKLAVKTPINRISDPQEIANLILFVASEKAKGITGSEFVSDNGLLLI